MAAPIPPPGFVPVPQQDVMQPAGATPAPPPGFVPLRPRSLEMDPGQRPASGVTVDLSNARGRFGDGLKPYFGERNPLADTYDVVTAALDPRSNRPLVQRATDAASGVLAVPPSMLRLPTLGRVAESLTGDPAITNSERRFFENNRDLLRGVEAVGAIGAAAPMGMGYVHPQAPARPLDVSRATQLANDVAAFRRQGVPTPGVMFSEGPVASIGKQLSETPFVGAPVRNAIEDVTARTGQAVERVADAMGGAQSFDEAGLTIGRGLERYRSAGLDEIEPGVVQSLGINPTSAAPANQQMSGGAARAAQQAAPIRQQIGATTTTTTRGQQFAAGAPTQTTAQFLTRRTNVEDLSSAELGRVIRSPAADTSFASRAEALYERAWRMVPNRERSDSSVNPNLVAPVNTRIALQQIDAQIANQIAGQSAVNGELFARLTNPRSNITLSDLRAIRTEVGRAMSSTNPLHASLNRGQLASVYAAISRDVEIGLETLANRAAIDYSRGRLSEAGARQAAQALRAMRTADRYFRSGMGRVERFNSLLSVDNPERAAQRLVSAAIEGGRGNIGMVVMARSALREDEWGQISGLLLREMGRPNPSARGVAQEVGFSPAAFLTKWTRMDPRARQAFFGTEHATAINDLEHIIRRAADVEATTNTSRSATNALNLSGVLAAGGAIAAGDGGLTLIGSTISAGAVAKLLASPALTRWLVRYAQIKARPGNAPRAIMASHLGLLASMAARNQDLAPVVHEIGSQELANGRRR